MVKQKRCQVGKRRIKGKCIPKIEVMMRKLSKRDEPRKTKCWKKRTTKSMVKFIPKYRTQQPNKYDEGDFLFVRKTKIKKGDAFVKGKSLEGNYYEVAFNRGSHIGHFKTKAQAIKKANKYMKAHSC